MFEYRVVTVAEGCLIERRGPGGGEWTEVAAVQDQESTVETLGLANLFAKAELMKDVLGVFIDDVNAAYGLKGENEEFVKVDGEVEISAKLEEDWPEIIPTYNKALESLGRSPIG